MYLVEIFLPLAGNDGRRFDSTLFQRLRLQLTQQFGGVTAFTRAPAQGTFDSGSVIVHDDIVVFEVMTENLDRGWWLRYRLELEKAFAQETILIRATKSERL